MTPSLDPPVVALLVENGLPPDALAVTTETLGDFGIGVAILAPFENGAVSNNVVRRSETQGWRAVIVASEDAKLPAAMARALAQPVIRVPFGRASTPGFALLQDEGGDLPASFSEDEPFATVAIGTAGAKNAALFVISLLALDDDRVREAWEAFRAAQTEAVLRQEPPSLV